jgi:hypothetical protein
VILDLCKCSKIVSLIKVNFIQKIMSISLRRLLELHGVPFHVAIIARFSKNKEYHVTFGTLSRGTLLFSKTS